MCHRDEAALTKDPRSYKRERTPLYYVLTKPPAPVERVTTYVALGSLDAVAGTGAQTVLTGHGKPWWRGAAAMADEARRAGVS